MSQLSSCVSVSLSCQQHHIPSSPWHLMATMVAQCIPMDEHSTIYPSRKSSSPESEPPNLRNILKAIITKDWQRLDCTSPSTSNLAPRPATMRMKDSDDYITARAANPRTGLISPSVGTRTPYTPDSPSDALKLCSKQCVTPTPSMRTQGLPGNMNESGIIDSRAVDQRPDNPEWLSRNSTRLAENAVDDADSCFETKGLDEDQFVVHMPSAREPQPFAYPGYSAEQIEALDHYRAKTRRVSNEGYDRRLVSGGEDCSPDRCSHEEVTWIRPAAGNHFKPYRYRELGEPGVEPSEIFVRKRHAGTIRLLQEIDHFSPHENARPAAKTPKPAASPLAAPFTSPKNAAITEGESIQISRVPRAHHGPTKHAQKCAATRRQFSRKAVRSAPSVKNVANSDLYQTVDKDAARSLSASIPPPDLETRGVRSLRYLPHVGAVRPELTGSASQPTQHGLRRTSDGKKRHCSFGCHLETDNGECRQRRRHDSIETVIRLTTPFTKQVPHEGATIEDTNYAELTLTMLLAIFDYLTCIRLPKSNQIETLLSHESSIKDKAEALKAMFSVAARAVALCTTLAVLWKLGAAVMLLLEVLLWPLRMLKWIFVGS